MTFNPVPAKDAARRASVAAIRLANHALRARQQCCCPRTEAAFIAWFKAGDASQHSTQWRYSLFSEDLRRLTKPRAALRVDLNLAPRATRHFSAKFRTPRDRPECQTTPPIDLHRHRSPAKPPYSHSIINERSKPLTRKPIAAATQTFTVIFTVNLSGTSNGAGFRPVRPRRTFPDLSTSIDSREHRGHHRHTSASVRDTPKKRWHRTPQAIVPTHFFA